MTKYKQALERRASAQKQLRADACQARREHDEASAELRAMDDLVRPLAWMACGYESWSCFTSEGVGIDIQQVSAASRACRYEWNASGVDECVARGIEETRAEAIAAALEALEAEGFSAADLPRRY